ncbi:hypothetical protein [Sphingomonas dokdonensis]|nr:hypothetical protein [Sphingomonas dokdonensis]
MKRAMVPAALLIIGVVAATLIAALPQALLDVLMWRLGLPYILSAATPPIGAFGRTMLALIALVPFVVIAALMLRQRGYRIGAQPLPALANPDAALRAPTIRRADAHPDAAPRRPIRAEEDLGPPLPMVTAKPLFRDRSGEQDLPRDLDQPLAAFDPVSIPDVPRDPVPVVSRLSPAVASRHDLAPTAPSAIETKATPEPSGPAPFEAAPLARLDAVTPDTELVRMDDARRDQPRPPAVETGKAAEEPVTAAPLETPTRDRGVPLSSLLDRLERGARQRQAPPKPETVSPTPAPADQPETLADTLLMLRQMARR